MGTVEEDQHFIWREVPTPSSSPSKFSDSGDRRRARDLLLAIDHGPNSKHAFDWALAHFCRMADTLHLIHAVPAVKDEAVCQSTQVLMESLAAEAFQVSKVKTVGRIVEGDAGKVICREAERLRPAAVITGTSGRGLVQSVLQGSVSEYCLHHCKVAPVIVVPGKECGEHSTV